MEMESYQPSAEEVKGAEDKMSELQKDASERREKLLTAAKEKNEWNNIDLEQVVDQLIATLESGREILVGHNRRLSGSIMATRDTATDKQILYTISKDGSIHLTPEDFVILFPKMKKIGMEKGIKMFL